MSFANLEEKGDCAEYKNKHKRCIEHTDEGNDISNSYDIGKEVDDRPIYIQENKRRRAGSEGSIIPKNGATSIDNHNKDGKAEDISENVMSTEKKFDNENIEVANAADENLNPSTNLEQPIFKSKSHIGHKDWDMQAYMDESVSENAVEQSQCQKLGEQNTESMAINEHDAQTVEKDKNENETKLQSLDALAGAARDTFETVNNGILALNEDTGNDVQRVKAVQDETVKASDEHVASSTNSGLPYTDAGPQATNINTKYMSIIDQLTKAEHGSSAEKMSLLEAIVPQIRNVVGLEDNREPMAHNAAPKSPIYNDKSPEHISKLSQK